MDQFNQEALEKTNRKENNNKLAILDNFEYLNLNPKISIDTKLDKIATQSFIQTKPKENETVNDWLDDLLN